jgi:hypothetical protein
MLIPGRQLRQDALRSQLLQERVTSSVAHTCHSPVLVMSASSKAATRGCLHPTVRRLRSAEQLADQLKGTYRPVVETDNGAIVACNQAFYQSQW